MEKKYGYDMRFYKTNNHFKIQSHLMMYSTEFKNSLIIAIDFDGTIVEHRYPFIGRIRPFAFETMEAFQKQGHRLILWTHRTGQKLDEAIKFCSNHGIEFYAVNKNYPEETWDINDSRKILADIYIDDRNLGGLPQWGEIYNIVCPPKENTVSNRKSWWERK